MSDRDWSGFPRVGYKCYSNATLEAKPRSSEHVFEDPNSRHSWCASAALRMHTQPGFGCQPLRMILSAGHYLLITCIITVKPCKSGIGHECGQLAPRYNAIATKTVKSCGQGKLNKWSSIYSIEKQILDELIIITAISSQACYSFMYYTEERT